MQEKAKDGASAASERRDPEKGDPRFHGTEAHGCMPCDACSGFRAPNQPCAACAGRALLLSELLDVATGKLRHVYAGSCPNVESEGVETMNDRADPMDACPACGVLRRADAVLGRKVSDRSDTLKEPARAIGAVAFPEGVDTETLRELDVFREKMLGFFPPNFDASRVILDTHLLKVRAHIIADELNTKRLQAEIMRLASSNFQRNQIFSEQTIARVLDLDPGWELAPQKARDAARSIKT